MHKKLPGKETFIYFTPSNSKIYDIEKEKMSETCCLIHWEVVSVEATMFMLNTISA